MISIRIDGPAAGNANMAADVAMAREVGTSRSIMPGVPPDTPDLAVRLYTWSPPAISIGHHQDEREFDIAKLRALGYGFVRRPTGGRAILHDDELTYCIAAATGAFRPAELYRLASEALRIGAALLGIPAELSTAPAGFREHYATAAGAACFTLPAPNELVWRGKKIAGSAQRRLGSALLQHGSFLLGPGHRRIADFLAATGGTDAGGLLEGATDAAEILGRSVGFDEAAAAFAKGFREAFSMEPA